MCYAWRKPPNDGDERMKFLAPLAFAGLMAVTPAAADLIDMDDAERDAFRAEVRAYLLENPEVLMEAIGVLEQRQAAAEAERDQMGVVANEDALFNSAFDWVGGNPDGDVVLVEFMDYRCGFCRRAHPEVADLIDLDGNIRYIVKEFPILGEQSTMASQFAIATRIVNGDDAYAQMNDALMVMRGDVNEASLAATANEIGLDPAPILDAMDDPLVAQTIAYNRDLAQRRAAAHALLLELAQDRQRQAVVRADQPGAVAMRAGLRRGLEHARAQALAAHLQQAEAEMRPTWMRARSVFSLSFIRAFRRRRCSPLVHVDEVDHDQPGEVAQAQLARHLLGGLEVGLERGLLDRAFLGGPARVHVDRHQRLGHADHDVAAGFQLHRRVEHRGQIAST
jgi:protein-disulfide isomerase